MSQTPVQLELETARRMARATLRVEQMPRVEGGPEPETPGFHPLMIAKATGTLTGGGLYTGRSVFGVLDVDVSANLTLPGNLAVAADDDLVLHFPEEAGHNTHILQIPSFVVGVLMGVNSTQSKNSLLILATLGSTASAATLGSNLEGSESADTASSWTRTTLTAGSAYGGCPLDLWMCSRVVYNHAGDKKLYGFARKLSFDACGRLLTVSAETRYEIDAAGACP